MNLALGYLFGTTKGGKGQNELVVCPSYPLLCLTYGLKPVAIFLMAGDLWVRNLGRAQRHRCSPPSSVD